jgi:LAS superfamily LD-carboxypeptidase LdcB
VKTGSKLSYPTKRLVVPEALGPVANGKLPRRLLRKTKAGGYLYVPVAKSFNAMWKHARSEGVDLKLTGNGYRSYERQYAMFMDRYSLEKTGRVPEVTRIFDGRKYFLKKGKSPSATPGTSNHGYGLAVDLDVSNHKVFAWLDANAPTYGFYLQGKPTRADGSKNPEYEGWHWQKVDA